MSTPAPMLLLLPSDSVIVTTTDSSIGLESGGLYKMWFEGISDEHGRGVYWTYNDSVPYEGRPLGVNGAAVYMWGPLVVLYLGWSTICDMNAPQYDDDKWVGVERAARKILYGDRVFYSLAQYHIDAKILGTA